MKRAPRTIPVCCLLALAISPALALDLGQVKVVKATSGPLAAKPADLTYTREDGESSTQVQGALLLRDQHLASVSGTMESTWGLSLGYSKNTLAAKRSERASAGGAVASHWSPFGTDHTIHVTLDALAEQDRVSRSRGRALLLEALLDRQHLCARNIESGFGVHCLLRPSIGYYRRRISGSGDPLEVPNGSFAGTFIGFNLAVRLLEVSPEPLPVVDRLVLTIAGTASRDSHVSGGYEVRTYRYGEASLDFLLAGSLEGQGWKAFLGATRTTGTYRPTNEPRKDTTTVGLRFSKGI